LREEDLRLLLQRQPCPVLRLHLSTGMIFEVRAGDDVVITRSTVELLLPPDGSRDREAVISLLHVAWVEVVTPQA
jgi:hypothetical protein